MIDKEMLQNFRKDFSEAVRSLEAKYNIKLELGNITYDWKGDSFSGSLKGQDNRGGEQATFNRYCGWYGLRPEDYKAVFTDRRHTYEIIGFDKSSKKYPITVRDINTGDLANYTTTYILQMLGR